MARLLLLVVLTCSPSLALGAETFFLGGDPIGDVETFESSGSLSAWHAGSDLGEPGVVLESVGVEVLTEANCLFRIAEKSYAQRQFSVPIYPAIPT